MSFALYAETVCVESLTNVLCSLPFSFYLISFSCLTFIMTELEVFLKDKSRPENSSRDTSERHDRHREILEVLLGLWYN